MLKIALAQLAPVVGAFELNLKQIQEAYEKAVKGGARILVTPELCVSGYPLFDLLDRPEVLERSAWVLDELRRMTVGQTCALVVGHVGPNPAANGRAARNELSIFENGRRVFHQAKTLLPSYDIFDEPRYFEPATDIQLWNCDGVKIALAICEDLWGQSPTLPRPYYRVNPLEKYRELQPDLLFSLSASPYEWGKAESREALHRQVAKSLKVPLIYVNQTGATDEVLFDGASFILGDDGALVGRLPFFEPAFATVSLFNSDQKIESSLLTSETPDEMGVLLKGLVVGIREYFSRTGFKGAILGLSGGIDSAVVAALAARALGAENILGVAMPSQYSSGHSLEDAEALARNLGVQFEVRPIKFMYSTTSRILAEDRGELASVALENLQARLRGITLMTLSNHGLGKGTQRVPALVLTTGNKSEIAMGYCTLYGDMAGALAPIGDLLKTQVYQLAHFINQTWGALIPARTLTKPPSAELKPGQTDQDSLPPYDLLDAFLKEYLVRNASLQALESQFEPSLKKYSFQVRDLVRRLEMNEYKRRQSAPCLKVSGRAFGIGRRVPIAKA